MTKKIAAFIYIITTLTINLFGQSNRYNFGHINYTNGLTSNHVLCIEKGPNGLMWFGSTNGLNRYDGYNIKAYKNIQNDSTSLPDNLVQTIIKDQLGRLWTLTPSHMSVFNTITEKVEYTTKIIINNVNINVATVAKALPYDDSIMVLSVQGMGVILHNIYTNNNKLISATANDTNTISQNHVVDFAITGNFAYLVFANGFIDILNLKTNKVTKKISLLANITNTLNNSYRCYIDYAKNLWITPNNSLEGLYYINIKNNTLRQFTTTSKPALSANIVTSIIQDADSAYWIGTDHGGITILNPKLTTAIALQNEPENENSISQNVITTLYKDNQDIIWIGTFKQGVNYYHKNYFTFYHYRNQGLNPLSLPYNDVNCFAEDKKGNLWIGTNGYGLIYFDRANDQFIPFDKIKPAGQKLASDVIVALHFDNKNQLWIGTYHGGLSVYDGKNIKTYMHNPKQPSSIADNKVWDIFEDSRGNFWIGMLSGGVDLFDPRKEIFVHYSGNTINSINSSFVMDITEDQHSNIWFGTDYGLFVLRSNTGRIEQYSNIETTPGSLSNNFVYSTFVDSKGRIWAGTRNGLNLYNPVLNNFTVFNTEHGLPDNTIMAIRESDQGHIWFSTLNGLCKLIAKTNDSLQYISHATIIYNEDDGLQGREFNEGSSLKTRRGELIFGGPNGFNLFETNNKYKTKAQINTHILSFEIFGSQASTNPEYKNIGANKAILNNQTIKLNYKDNIFSLHFAAIEFLRSKKMSYRYKLEGFNEQWITTDWKNRKATYTNLSPGEYIFRVQAYDNDAQWYANEAELTIIVLPPWYRTNWAFLAYYIGIFISILIFRQSLLTRERLKFKQQQAMQESERQHELNRLKTRFFTNVSHEFRTPLTLLLTPLERLLKKEHDPETQKSLVLIHQNARRLLGLVNQLLDFRKAEENRLMVQYVYGNIISFINRIILSFSDLKESKNITLTFNTQIPELFMQFDPDKIEKILFNLLSNAFKFTHSGGSISVNIKLINNQPAEQIQIQVTDTGIGLSAENTERVFERFFQSQLPNTLLSKGTGVGLSLTKDFVELLKGTVSCQSTLGKGSTFTVTLPVNRDKSVIELETPEPVNYKLPIIPDTKNIPSTGLTILLVEDNDDFRFYLKDNLKEKYNILEAPNGKIALQMVDSYEPSLIVSDVMMPEMDGLELCRQIKTNAVYSHIPVILLTAKSGTTDQIEGYNTGADDYIIKPFSFEILESRIAYLINRRKQFIKQYQKTLKIEPETKYLSAIDTRLLEETKQYVEKNLAETSLTVENLSRELNISRVHLYKKLLALTGKTPVEYIRTVKLKKAAELLLTTNLTISEVCYEVGFSDPRYFSKQFKTEFNMLPSKFKETQTLD